MKQLVASWIKAEQEWHSHSLPAALEQMNRALNTATTPSRVSEWRRGVYVPSTEAISYMLAQTLPWAMKASGISIQNDQNQRLTELLWETGVEDGEAFVELL